MGSGPPSRQDKYQSAPVGRSRAGGPASGGRGQCPDRRAPRERLGSPQSCGHLTPLRRVTGVRRAGPDGPSRCRTWLLARVVGVTCCGQARCLGLFRGASGSGCRDEITHQIGEAVRFIEVREVASSLEQLDATPRDRLLRTDRMPRRDHPVPGAPDDECRDRRGVGQVVVGIDSLAPRPPRLHWAARHGQAVRLPPAIDGLLSPRLGTVAEQAR